MCYPSILKLVVPRLRVLADYDTSFSIGFSIVPKLMLLPYPVITIYDNHGLNITTSTVLETSSPKLNKSYDNWSMRIQDPTQHCCTTVSC